jgi:hypothetical protein
MSLTSNMKKQMVKYILVSLLVLPNAACVNYTLKSMFKIDSDIVRILIGTVITTPMLIGTAILLKDEV